MSAAQLGVSAKMGRGRTGTPLSLQWVDSLPSEIRSLVHEYGEAAVRACWDCRVTNAAHIRDLILSVRRGAAQTPIEGVSRAQLVEMLSAAVVEAGGVNRFAKKSGVSNCLVSRTLNRQIQPARAIASALGFIECVEFIRTR